jgi:hypothetical protein
MGSWQSRSWGVNELGSVPSSLDSVVGKLNPAAKQAMYAAANKGLIARKTWDGCAFNAGGLEVGKNVSSYLAASQAFGLDQQVVENFIYCWDGLPGSDYEATEALKEAILKAGLFTEPNESKGRRILRETVYKSFETKQREAFESLVADLDMDDVDHELVQDIHSAAELLSVGV